MYGIIIVDPKEGYSSKFPRPDREYVLIQSQYFPNADDYKAMLENKGWTNALVNGKIFHYDPVHDPDASLVLEAKPGERVRIYFVNANVNMLWPSIRLPAFGTVFISTATRKMSYMMCKPIT